MDEPRCSDCGVRAPETDTMHTLFGAKHGWRLTREKTESGAILLKLRCPACWRAYKESGAARPSSRSWTRSKASPSSPEKDEDPSDVFARATKRLRG